MPGSFRFRALWLAIGYLLVAATAWNSLHAMPPPWAFIAGDIWLHGSTYFVLAYWFGQLYPGRTPQVWVALAFFGLGGVLEVMQAELTPFRAFEWSDLAANAGGAATAWLVLRTPASRVLAGLDGCLARALPGL